MQFAYIGPQSEELLGWEPESWVSAQECATRIHEEEREQIVNFCVAQSKSGIDHEADYRALTKNGDYVWIRDVVHVVRDESGEVEALIGFMFDISESKKTEAKLIDRQTELETWSFQKGTPDVANSRMFDWVLEMGWDHARRNNQPRPLDMIAI